MQRYDSYKDSGEQWLGRVPSHWDIKRLGSYFLERKVKVSDKEYAPLSVTKNGILPQLDNVAKSNDNDNRKLVKAGDFVINSRSDRKGSSGVSMLDGSVSLINLVLQPRNGIIPSFCNYLLKSYPFVEEYYRNGRGIVADLWTTRYDEMKSIKLAMPPIAEQKRMVEYLDVQTAQIDEAIAQQQKMIDLLNERKQIIINNAVTKGLNPNVPMKDSGVEWIGMIPEPWNVRKLKFLCSCNDDVLPENNKGKIRYVEIGDVSFSKGITNYTDYDFSDAPTRARRITYKGDVIISTVRTYLKAIAKIEEDSLITSTGFAVLRAKSIDPDFLAYALMNESFVSKVLSESNGVSYPAITAKDLMNIPIALPERNEQEIIVEYLKSITQSMNSIIKRYETLILKMQERKQIIINEVVTGKIKV